MSLPERALVQPSLRELTALWLVTWTGLAADPWAFATPQLMAWVHGIRAWMPVLAGAWACRAMMRAGWPSRGPLLWALLYAAAGMGSSLLVSPNPVLAIYWAAMYAAVGLVALYSLRTPLGARRLWALTCLAVTLIGLGAWFVAQISAPSITLHGIMNRMPSILGQPMIRETGIGRYMALLSLLSLCRAVVISPGTRRWVWFAGAATFLLATAYSASRSAMLGCAAGWAWVAWMWTWRRPAWRWALGVVTGLVVTAVCVRVGTVDRLIGMLSGREWLWLAADELLRDSVWLGQGFHADRLWLGWPFRTHISGALMHAAAQAGVLGLAAFAAAWIDGWRRAGTWVQTPASRPLLEAGAVFAFFSARALFESSGAFYGVDWLLLASVFALLGSV